MMMKFKRNVLLCTAAAMLLVVAILQFNSTSVAYSSSPNFTAYLDKFNAHPEQTDDDLPTLTSENQQQQEEKTLVLPSPIPDQETETPQVKYEHERLVIVTTVATGEMEQMREFVGSVHKLRETNFDVHQIIIYGFGLSRKERNELSLWRNVEYIDGFQAIFLGQRSMPPETNELPLPSPEDAKQSLNVLLNIIDVNLRKLGKMVFVKNNLRFTRDSIHDIAQIIESDDVFIAGIDQDLQQLELLDGSTLLNFPVFGFKFGSKMSHMFVSFQLQCLRGYHCDELFHDQLSKDQTKFFADKTQKLTDFGLEVYNGNAERFCNLLLRDDVLYSFEYGSLSHDKSIRDLLKNSNVETNVNDKRTLIAIGMPTRSVYDLTSFKDVSPIRTFLPAFLKSISNEEWSLFRYVIYIGYDEDDLFFSDSDRRKEIDSELKRLVEEYRLITDLSNVSISFEYIEFPFSKGWVTFIWNGLYVHAVKDGAQYFYQVNDDLRLTSSEWTIPFVNSLKNQDDIGVVGPNDPNHPGGLLTQAFVSRKHFEIFGKLYPIDIKDWFSDNWITDVYGERKAHIKGVSAQNLNDKGTRYTICQQPNYREILEKGKVVLRDWLADYETKQSTERVQREFNYGPIVN